MNLKTYAQDTADAVALVHQEQQERLPRALSALTDVIEDLKVAIALEDDYEALFQTWRELAAAEHLLATMAGWASHKVSQRLERK